MESNRKATAFSAVAFGLIAICFLLLLQEVVFTRKLWAEIPRIFAGFLVPVPVAVYVGFLCTHRGAGVKTEPSPIAMTVVLTSTLVLVLGVGWLPSSGPESETIGMGPVITQAAVFSASILNLLFLRNRFVASLIGDLTSILDRVLFSFSMLIAAVLFLYEKIRNFRAMAILTGIGEGSAILLLFFRERGVPCRS